MITLYGTVYSRAFRCLWMLEEAGVAYELTSVDFAKGETRTPEYLALNPNGHVPFLVDGDLKIWESLAINLHIAKRYAPSLWPQTADQESLLYMWTHWVMGEIEGPHDAANKAGGDLNAEALDRSLEALRQALGDVPYLLGSEFSVADLNVASVLLRPKTVDVVKADGALQDWFSRCTTRPALARVFAD